jgi:hypothetical protein
MVNVSKTPLYKGRTRIESDAWIASIGRTSYPGVSLIVRRQGDEWHVYKG